MRRHPEVPESIDARNYLLQVIFDVLDKGPFCISSSSFQIPSCSEASATASSLYPGEIVQQYFQPKLESSGISPQGINTLQSIENVQIDSTTIITGQPLDILNAESSKEAVFCIFATK